MDTEKLLAVLMGAGGSAKRIEADGDNWLVTNGHLVVKVSAEQIKAEPFAPLLKFEKHDKIKALWDKTTAAPNTRAVPGGLKKAWDHYYRSLDAEKINEAFFRCFPGCEFRLTGPEKPVVVFSEDRPIALIALIRSGAGAGDKVADKVSDELVFRPFANETNGFFAQTADYYKKQLAELEKDLEKWMEKMEEAEIECVDLRSQITECRAAMKAKK